MGDLQIGLIILGVVLIVMVFAFNKWQNRRLRKLQSRFAARPERHGANVNFSVQGGQEAAGFSAKSGEDKPLGHFSAASGEDKSPSYFSVVSGEDKSPGHFSAVSGEDKLPGYFSAASGEDKSPSHFSAVSREDKSPSYFSAASAQDKSPGHFSAASVQDKPASHFSTVSVQDKSPSHFSVASAQDRSPSHFSTVSAQDTSSAYFSAESESDVALVDLSVASKQDVVQMTPSKTASASHSMLRHESDQAPLREENASPSGSSGVNAEIEDKDDVDPVCEVVIEVVFAQPVAGAALLSVAQNLRRAGRKSIRIFGQTYPQRYHAKLHPSSQYIALQIAVLLADRRGPLSAIEWSQIWVDAQALAERFDGMVEGPDQQGVVARAKQLDETCAALDSQVALKLFLQTAQPGATVVAIARDLGFVPEGQLWVWRSEVGHRGVMLTQDGQGFDATHPAVERLDLLLDVPCTTPHEHAFSRMVEIGQQLARRLHAELVDDQGKALAPHAVTVIDQHLQTLFHKLEQAGLRAGSERARRVFA